MENDYYLQFKNIITELQNINGVLNVILQEIQKHNTQPKDGD
jgi:hypothetical protein